MSDLIKYTQGSEVVPLRDRRVARQAKKVYDDVRLAALKAEGLMALSGKLMEELVELDAFRRELTQRDPALDALLLDIELAAARQVKSIQNHLYGPFEG